MIIDQHNCNNRALTILIKSEPKLQRGAFVIIVSSILIITTLLPIIITIILLNIIIILVPLIAVAEECSD